ncbi:MAG: TIGR00730 family Rossman fold protein [Rhodobacteraceae bacterium]|nr:TIGR00730 family Rossman fold protein [Paracoccaceae bacterium]
MTTQRSICVYCGSSYGDSPLYEAAATRLGQLIGEHGHRLVYGGGDVGLMGTVARAAIENGSKVCGIIPHFLESREKMLTQVDELIVTNDMHERKMLMYQNSDAFVALPGGIGTLEEVVEMMSWAQLGEHQKPIVLANINGFWSPFLALLDHMHKESFIGGDKAVPYMVTNQIEEVVPMLCNALEPDAQSEHDGTDALMEKV